MLKDLGSAHSLLVPYGISVRSPCALMPSRCSPLEEEREREREVFGNMSVRRREGGRGGGEGVGGGGTEGGRCGRKGRGKKG